MPPKSDDVCDDTSTAAGSRFGKEMDGFFCLRVVNTVAYHHRIIVFGGYANRICIQPKPSSSSSSRERETRCDEYSATRCCCSCSLLPKLLPFFDAKSDATTRMVVQKGFLSLSLAGKETLNLVINPKP